MIVVKVVELGSWHKLNVGPLSSTTPYYYYQVPSRGNHGAVRGVQIVLVFLSGPPALHS